MCATCSDLSSTNNNLCSAAKIERAKIAYQVVEMKGSGKHFREVAEELNIGLATAHKLFKLGIKNMAPPGAEDQLMILMLQLETQYSRIMHDLEDTADPGEKAKLYMAALANIRERRVLFGGVKVTIKHTVQNEFDAEIEELHKAFQEDQDIRNATRAKRRAAGQ